MDPPNRQLQTAGLHTLDAIDKTAHSIDYVKEAVAKLRNWKVRGKCNVNVELLKAFFM